MHTDHALQHWRPFLTSQEDYDFLIGFVERAKHKQPNQEMLLLAGPGRTGKSTLIKEICEYIGSDHWAISDTYGSAFLQPIVSVIEIPGIDDFQKKHIQQLRNAIYFGQGVIAATNHPEKINKDLLKNTRIIKMEHVF